MFLFFDASIRVLTSGLTSKTQSGILTSIANLFRFPILNNLKASSIENYIICFSKLFWCYNQRLKKTRFMNCLLVFIFIFIFYYNVIAIDWKI